MAQLLHSYLPQVTCTKIKSIILSKYPNAQIFLFGSWARWKGKNYPYITRKWLNVPCSDIDISIMLNYICPRYDYELNNMLTKEIWIETHCVFCSQDNEWNLLKL